MPLPHKVTGILDSKTIALAPPIDTLLLTLIIMILLGAWMETSTSVVSPPTRTSDSQDSCLTLLWSFKDNMEVML